MKTTLQSLNFPVPVIVIPKEKSDDALSYITLTKRNNSTSSEQFVFLYGYMYIAANNTYVIQTKLLLKKFTIAFWFESGPGEVKIFRDNDDVAVISCNNNRFVSFSYFAVVLGFDWLLYIYVLSGC